MLKPASLPGPGNNLGVEGTPANCAVLLEGDGTSVMMTAYKGCLCPMLSLYPGLNLKAMRLKYRIKFCKLQLSVKTCNLESIY